MIIDRRSLLPLEQSSSLLGLGGGATAAPGGGAVDGCDTLELPLSFHNATAGGGHGTPGGRTRLLLDDTHLTVTPVASPSAESGGSAATVGHLRGLASAQCHALPNGDQKVMTVTTAGDPDRHLILLVEARAGSAKASSIELDLSGLSQLEGTRPVKVKTFLHPTIPDDAYAVSDVGDDMRHNMARFSEDAAGRGGGPASYDLGNYGRPYGYGSRGSKASLTLRVVLVDTAGTIVTVFLSCENGILGSITRGGDVDVRPMLIHSIPSLVASSAPHLYLTPGTTLSTSDVDFLTPTRLVVALSPHLLCIDVVKERVVAWTMAVGRRSTIGTIFSQAGSLLVGQEVDDDEYIEESVGGSVGASADGEERMAPVSALTVVTHQAGAGSGGGEEDEDESNATTTVVFTLHADGSLRLWFCGTKLSLLPKKVRMIRVPGEIGASALLDQGDPAAGAGGLLGLLSARKAPRQKKVQHPGEDPPLPEPNTWSTDADAVMISGKLYEQPSVLGGGIGASIDIAADDGGVKVLRYALAVSVRTVEDPLADLEFAEQEGVTGVASPTAKRNRSPSFTSASGIGSPHHSSKPQRQSPCHVLVLSGEADGKASLAGHDGAVPLIVPSDARKVVDLDFPLGDGLCELHALLSTGFDSEKRRYLSASALGSSISGDDVDIAAAAAACSTGSILAVYPPSSSTVISHSSLPIGVSSSVDFTALAERDSIIDLRDGLRADIEGGVYATIEEAATAVDRACMTKLFRGCGIRSAGGNHASPATIERAISKLVPSSNGLPASGAAGSRVDVLALLAIQEWTRSDEARSTLLALGQEDNTPDGANRADGDAASSDIYRAFAKTPSKANGRPDRSQMELTYEEEESEEMERKKKSLAHLSRWIKFLLAVFEEESIRREVLCLTSLSNISSASSATMEASVILRGGMTSVVVASSSPSSEDTTAFGRLDALAVKVFRHLQLSSSDSLSVSLRHAVHRIAATVAKAGLVMSKLDQDIIESLTFLGASALNEMGSGQSKYAYSATLDGATTGNTVATVTSLLDALSEEEISQWLSPSSAMDSATVRPFQLSGVGGSDGGKASLASSLGGGLLTATAAAAEHSASSSAYLSHLYIDSVCDLCLARCLLVLGTKRLVSATAESARAASAMMGRTAGAIMGGDAIAITDSVDDEVLIIKALRAYFQALSVQWAASQKLETGSASATLIDTAPVRSEAHGGGRPRVDGGAEATQMLTVLEAVCSSLTKAAQGPLSGDGGSTSSLTMAACVVDVAKLFVTMAYGGDNSHTDISQIAMLGPFTDQARIALRLLAPFVSYPEEFGSISQVAAECLLREATFAEVNRTMPDDRIMALRERASAILLECQVDPSTIDVLKAVQVETDCVSECAVRYNRGAVLERYCSGSIVLKANLDLVGAIDTLLLALKDDQDQASAPGNIGELEMLKARTISSAFQHAMISKDYEKAYDATISNPIKERRLSCFKRLVLGIADAGAFHHLLGMSLTVVGRPNEFIDNAAADSTAMVVEGEESKVDATADELDLYELAAEVLANAASEQSRSLGIRGATNYSGCLYALHASRNNWRRAAAAMAFSGTLASAKAAAVSSEGGKREDGMAAVDAIALSALAAAHSIQLEDNPSHRFIVRNEISQYPVPPSFRDAMDDPSALATKKRSRDGQNRLFDQELSQDSSPAASRSSRLMLEKDLIADAIRAVGLRTVLLDQTNSEADLLAALQANDRVILDQLASQGNYSLALGLAKALYDDHKGGKPHRGRDIFADALSYVLCTYVVPSAIKDQMGTSSAGEHTRPTLSQIRSSAEIADAAQSAAVALPSTNGWKAQGMQAQMAQAAASMDLLRIYTTKYANSSNSLAIEVATALLDTITAQGGTSMSALPVWLTDLLCGTSASCFADRVPPGDDQNGMDVASGAASPSALVKLYIERARYADACEVVAKVLDGSGSRVSNPSARLPEEGSIDFVPYNTIDQLYSIIENARFTSEEAQAKVLMSRTKMEEALERHFERMKISEEGTVSARALLR